MNQKLLAKNIFAFYFNSKEDEAKGIFSDMTFGYYDKTKFEGEISWNTVKHQLMYAVPFENILFNGKESNICK